MRETFEACAPQYFDATDPSGNFESWFKSWHDCGMLRPLIILVQLAADAVRWCGLVLRLPRSIEAENLFLRRQLALYKERGVKPRRMDPATRIALALLSRHFD